MDHRLHLYWGTGKGKTTAAMGLALRCLGHGQSVLIVQFMKAGTSGELEALRKLSGAIVYPSAPVQGFLYQMTTDEVAAVRIEQTHMAKDLTLYIQAHHPHMIILDEFALAWQLGIVDESAAIALITTALESGETVTTGMNAPDWLLQHADYISRVEAQRHPYETEKLNARECIEW